MCLSWWPSASLWMTLERAKRDLLICWVSSTLVLSSSWLIRSLPARSTKVRELYCSDYSSFLLTHSWNIVWDRDECSWIDVSLYALCSSPSLNAINASLNLLTSNRFRFYPVTPNLMSSIIFRFTFPGSSKSFIYFIIYISYFFVYYIIVGYIITISL